MTHSLLRFSTSCLLILIFFCFVRGFSFYSEHIFYSDSIIVVSGLEEISHLSVTLLCSKHGARICSPSFRGNPLIFHESFRFSFSTTSLARPALVCVVLSRRRSRLSSFLSANNPPTFQGSGEISWPASPHIFLHDPSYCMHFRRPYHPHAQWSPGLSLYLSHVNRWVGPDEGLMPLLGRYGCPRLCFDPHCGHTPHKPSGANVHFAL